MRSHHPREVQHQAVIGVALDSHSSPRHLHIQTGAHRWAQHGDQVNVRVIKAGGQHIGIGKRTQTASFEVGNHALAFFLWCLTRHALSRHTLLAQDFCNVLRVLDASAENQPCFAVTS